MLQVLPAILILVLAACGDGPACHDVTHYMGPEIACDDGEFEGVCMPDADNDGAPTCRRRCATAGARCEDGERWATIVALSADTGEYEAPICYCEPTPTRHLVPPPVVRDHRDSGDTWGPRSQNLPPPTP